MPYDTELIQENPLRRLIVRQSTECPDAPFLLSMRSPRTLSFANLEFELDQFIDELDSWGMVPGDRVGLMVSDPVIAAQSLLAMMSMGLWVAPLDPSIAYIEASQIEDKTSTLDLCAVVSDKTMAFDIAIPWLSVLKTGKWPTRTNAKVIAMDARGGLILSSSGTTGTPKVIELSLDQVLEAATLVATHNRLTASDRGLNPLPLWHINAIVVGVLSSLLSGASLVLDDRFHRTDFWTDVERHGVTWINAVPAIIARLSEIGPTETISPRVRFIRSASAPLAAAQLKRFESATGIAIVESYGMTEAASQICANPLEGPRKIGSVGIPIGVDVRISFFGGEDSLSEDANHVVGQVEIRGASVISRYASHGYDDRFDKDGWLRTGDLGYFDDEGYLFLVGRTDDVINRGGEKILPRELEEVALKVDGVLSAAVIARQHEVYGHVPELFVQLRDVNVSTSMDELALATKELHDIYVQSFSRSRRPVSINVVDSMPSHSTGKIQKKFLSNNETQILYSVDLS